MRTRVVREGWFEACQSNLLHSPSWEFDFHAGPCFGMDWIWPFVRGCETWLNSASLNKHMRSRVHLVWNVNIWSSMGGRRGWLKSLYFEAHVCKQILALLACVLIICRKRWKEASGQCQTFAIH